MSTVVSLNVIHVSLLGTDLSFQFGMNHVEVPPKTGYLSKNNKPPLSSLLVSDQYSLIVKAVAGESPIRGLGPPREFCFGGLSCKTQPCALKSLAALWHTLLDSKYFNYLWLPLN